METTASSTVERHQLYSTGVLDCYCTAAVAVAAVQVSTEPTAALQQYPTTPHPVSILGQNSASPARLAVTFAPTNAAPGRHSFSNPILRPVFLAS